MRYIKRLAETALMAVVVLVLVSCQQPERQEASKIVQELPQPLTHEGFEYVPMSQDSVIWARTQYTRDATGEQWIRGIGIEPDATWRGCPCCPVQFDSGGCCLPCLLYDGTRYEGSEDPKNFVKDPMALVTFEHQFPVPGTVFATAACLVVRDPSSPDPLEFLFGITMQGGEAMESKADISNESRNIGPASEIGSDGQWVQFHQQFHVDSAATSFTLFGSAPTGSGGDVAQVRIITLTFVPELN